MPKIKESADTYLFMALTEVIKQHDISQISLISAVEVPLAKARGFLSSTV